LQIHFKFKSNLKYQTIPIYKKTQENFMTQSKICSGMDATDNYLLFK
jgi:hypothetical protein